MKEKITDFDPAAYLDSEETIAEYLTAILEENNPDLLLSALSDVARARGMAQIAKDSGLGRESLYKALAPGATLQAPAIWSDLRPRMFKSAWMEKAELSTTFSPSDSGEASSTKRFTSMSINLPRRLESGSSPGSPSTTGNDLTSPWGTRLPGRSYKRHPLRDRATKPLSSDWR